MKLEEITPEAQLSGVIPGVVVKVIAANLVGSDSFVANPPFNDSDWFHKNDAILWQYGVPSGLNSNN